MQITVVGLALFGAQAGADAQAGVNTWTPIGPNHASVCAVVFAHSNPRIVYAVGESENIFSDRHESWRMLLRSEDGGSTWSARRALPSRTSCSLGVSRFDADRISVEGGGSNDGGLTVVPHDASHPSITAQGVLYREGGRAEYSIDGRQWFPTPESLVNDENGLPRVTVNLNNPRNAIIATASVGRRLVTVDGGATWKELPFTYYWVSFDPVVAGRVFAVVGGQIEVSRDGGMTWAKASASSADGPPYWTYVSALSDASGTFLLASGSGIGRSGDAGATFSASQSEPSVFSSDPPSVDRVAQDPANPARLLVPSGGGIFESADSGRSWHPLVEIGMRGAPWQITGFGSRVYAKVAQRFMESTDAGRTWRNPLPSITANVVASDPHDNSAVAVAGYLDFRVSFDAGATWRSWAVSAIDPSSNDSIANIAVSGSTIIVVTGPRLYRSTDRGATWASRQIPCYTIQADPRDIRHLVVPEFSCGAVSAESRDAGDTWTSLPPPFGIRTFEGYPFVPSSFGRSMRGFDFDASGIVVPFLKGARSRFVPFVTGWGGGDEITSVVATTPNRFLAGTPYGLSEIEIVEPRTIPPPVVELNDSVITCKETDSAAPPVGLRMTLKLDGRELYPSYTNFDYIYKSTAAPGDYTCEETALGPFGSIFKATSKPLVFGISEPQAGPATDDTPDTTPQTDASSEQARVVGSLRTGTIARCALQSASRLTRTRTAWSVRKPGRTWRVRKTALKVSAAMAGGRVRCDITTTTAADTTRTHFSLWRRIRR